MEGIPTSKLCFPSAMGASLALAAVVSCRALYSTLDHHSRGIERVLVVIVACMAGTLWTEKGRKRGRGVWWWKGACFRQGWCMIRVLCTTAPSKDRHITLNCSIQGCIQHFRMPIFGSHVCISKVHLREPTTTPTVHPSPASAGQPKTQPTQTQPRTAAAD